MAEKLQVLVMFEFDGIDDPNSPEADEVIDELTQATKEWRTEYGADGVWVDEVHVEDGIYQRMRKQ